MSGTPDGASHESRSSGSGSFLRELPVLIVVAVVLAFLLRTFVLQVFYIPSSSMEPTLQVDDRMVVEKISYLVREPRRGEIVVFEGEDGDDVHDEALLTRAVRVFGQFMGVVPANARDFVKRIIAVGGDEVVIQDGVVSVNGTVLDEPYVAYTDEDDFGPVTVPPDHLFFLGDNRPNSSDSRRELGFVGLEAVVGRSVLILWPLEHTTLLTAVEHDVPDASASPSLFGSDADWSAHIFDSASSPSAAALSR